jgi:hypothetical protein
MLWDWAHLLTVGYDFSSGFQIELNGIVAIVEWAAVAVVLSENHVDLALFAITVRFELQAGDADAKPHFNKASPQKFRRFPPSARWRSNR